MTLREFDVYVRGYSKRMEANHHLLAWHAANLMNCWVKKKVTVDRLLGKGEAQPQSFEELQIQLREQQAKAEKAAAITFDRGEIEFVDPERDVVFDVEPDDDDDTLIDEVH